jgi:ankyrin repeat protein
MVAKLLDLGATGHIGGVEGTTALHYAASHGTKAVLLALLQHGAKVKMKDKDGLTPLNCAMAHKRIDLGMTLLKGGAMVNIKDDKGLRPLHRAVAWGAEVNAIDNKGWTAVELAAKEKHEVVEELDSRIQALESSQKEISTCPFGESPHLVTCKGVHLDWNRLEEENRKESSRLDIKF